MATSPARKARYRHIQRIDNDTSRTYCWKVHVRRKNQVFEHNFSDGVLGGKRKALQAAVAWRDEILLEIGKSGDPQNHDHLCRINRGANKFSWQVQFQCRERFVRMYFHDATYGGDMQAREAATTWRNAMLAVARHDRWLRNTTVLKSNNRSGTVGVGRSITREIVAGKEVERPYWYASWHDPQIGRQRRRKFFVSKYGETKAKSLAIKTRKAGMDAVIAAEERQFSLDDRNFPVLGSKKIRLPSTRPGTKAKPKSLAQKAV